jgi:hypothetical protein
LQQLISAILNFTSQFIIIEIFQAFGLYTCLYVLLRIFGVNKPILKTFDEVAVKIVVVSGVIFAIAWGISIILTLTGFFGEEIRSLVSRRMVGRYWFGYWLQPATYVLLSQLLRLNKIRNSLPVRFVFSCFLIISYELLVILSTSLHRDYLPSKLNDGNNILSTLFLGILFRLIFFILLTSIVLFVLKWIKKSKFTLTKTP